MHSNQIPHFPGTSVQKQGKNDVVWIEEEFVQQQLKNLNEHRSSNTLIGNI